MGQLEVICGPMFSGKTEELIRRVKRALIARRKVQVFKPRLDARYHADDVVSHSRQRMVSTVIDDAGEIPGRLAADVDVVAIDEVQFLGTAVVPIVKQLADRGLRVIVAGLDQDFRGAPFDPMPDLLAEAEYITKELAICVVCGAPANRSQRTVPVADRVMVGAQNAYEPRCRKDFSPEPVPPADSPTQELLPFLRDPP